VRFLFSSCTSIDCKAPKKIFHHSNHCENWYACFQLFIISFGQKRQTFLLRKIGGGAHGTQSRPWGRARDPIAPVGACTEPVRARGGAHGTRSCPRGRARDPIAPVGARTAPVRARGGAYGTRSRPWGCAWDPFAPAGGRTGSVRARSRRWGARMRACPARAHHDGGSRRGCVRAPPRRARPLLWGAHYIRGRIRTRSPLPLDRGPATTSPWLLARILGGSLFSTPTYCQFFPHKLNF
jgi:hypothetical protein